MYRLQQSRAGGGRWWRSSWSVSRIADAPGPWRLRGCDASHGTPRANVGSLESTGEKTGFTQVKEDR